MEGIGGIKTSSPAGSGASLPQAVTLRDLQERYPRLKLSAQSFGSNGAQREYAMAQSGKYNVAIDPRAIARMGEDSAFAEKMHATLAGVEENEDWLEREITKNPGTTLIASGTVIDKDGNANGWCVSMTSSSSEGMMSMSRKSREDLAKMVEEKHRQKADEAKRREKKAGEALEVEASLEVQKSASRKLDLEA